MDQKRFEMTDAELKDVIRENTKWIASHLGKGDHDSFAPMLAVTGKDPLSASDKLEMVMYALLVEFNEHDEKHAVMRKIGSEYLKTKRIPLVAVLMSECWMSKRRIGSPDDHCAPRDDPAREEGIQVAALTLIGKRCLMTFAPITRDKKNNIQLGEFIDAQDGASSPLIESFYRGIHKHLEKKLSMDRRN